LLDVATSKASELAAKLPDTHRCSEVIWLADDATVDAAAELMMTQSRRASGVVGRRPRASRDLT